MLYLIFILVSLGAAMIGAICGMGGGVIIKPVLDAFGVLPVSAISFLSGCTVLAMSFYSVVRTKLSGNSEIDMERGTPLAVGAAIGGIAGKYLFLWVSGLFADSNTVGAVQAAALGILTFGTLIYTLNKERISAHQIKNKIACFVIGFLLGMTSAFLGIGGGSINLVVLYFCFSMGTKVAAQNSLYIILCCQAANVLLTIGTGGMPKVPLQLLLGMIAAGIMGGIAGRWINRKIKEKTVEHLFVGLMFVIIAINIYNVVKYI